MAKLYFANDVYSDGNDDDESHDVIQFISQNKRGDLVLNDEALDIIREIKGDIAVFIIVGPYRQGKSSILNRLLNQSDGFKIGHTDNSCTKGIWMWRKPIEHKNDKNEKMSILYLDTEGIESDDSDDQWDAKIFLLGLLLSSMFCYNTKNALTADATKKLSAMSAITERIKADENENEDEDEDEDEDASIFNKSECSDFIWIVRDYSLQSTMTPKERLDKFLEEETTKDKKKQLEVNERNEIKRIMKGSFRTLDCFYLPCPVSDGTNGQSLEEALHEMDTLPFDKLRPQFRESMEKLCKIIKQRIRPKVLNSVFINGKVFAAYAKNIVENLNSNETIFLSQSLIASIKLAAYESLESVKNKYAQGLGRLKLPMNAADLNKFETDLYNECVNELQESIIGDNQVKRDTVDSFSEFRNLHCGQHKEKNNKAVLDFTFDSAKRVWEERMAPRINAFQSIPEFRNHMEAVKREYASKNGFSGTREAEESWLKWTGMANVSFIERTIQDRQQNQERMNELERQRKEQERIATEEARKRTEIERRNEEIRVENERKMAEERRRYEEMRRDDERRREEERRRNDELQRQLERQSQASYSSYSTPAPAFDLSSLLSGLNGGGGGGCQNRGAAPSYARSESSRSSSISSSQLSTYASLPKRQDGQPDRRFKATKDYYAEFGED